MDYERSPLENEIGSILQDVYMQLLQGFDEHMNEPQHIGENPDEVAFLRKAIEQVGFISACIGVGKLQDFFEVTAELNEEVAYLVRQKNEETLSETLPDLLEQMLRQMIEADLDDIGPIPDDFSLDEDDFDALLGLTD
jgi:hypothetical protein